MPEANIQPYLDIIANATDGDNVRDAIINCMSEINKESKYKVKSKRISGTVGNMETHWYAATGEVWKDVTLDLKLPDGSEVPESDIIIDDFTVDNDTPNGDHDPITGHRWGTIHVNIDWSQYANEDIAEIVEITSDNLDPDRTFHIETYGNGYTAMRAIRLADVASTAGGMIGPDGKTYYNVEYKNQAGNVVYKTQVQRGDDASLYYKGPQMPDEGHGGYLSGWLPMTMSRSITKDCTGANALTPNYGYDTYAYDTISESWSEILQDGGAHYPIGSRKGFTLGGGAINTVGAGTYKTKVNVLQIGEEPNPTVNILPDQFETVSIPSIQLANIQMNMCVVSHNEPGTSTTWLATIPLPAISAQFGFSYRSNQEHSVDYIQSTDWDDSPLRQWLNSGDFLSLIPDEIRSHIKTVKKQFMGVYAHTRAYNADEGPSSKTKDCKIWIPSTSEWYDYIHNTYDVDHSDIARIEYANAWSRGEHHLNSNVSRFAPNAGDYWGATQQMNGLFQPLLCRDCAGSNGELVHLDLIQELDEHGVAKINHNDHYVGRDDYSVNGLHHNIYIGFCT